MNVQPVAAETLRSPQAWRNIIQKVIHMLAGTPLLPLKGHVLCLQDEAVIIYFWLVPDEYTASV